MYPKHYNNQLYNYSQKIDYTTSRDQISKNRLHNISPAFLCCINVYLIHCKFPLIFLHLQVQTKEDIHDVSFQIFDNFELKLKGSSINWEKNFESLYFFNYFESKLKDLRWTERRIVNLNFFWQFWIKMDSIFTQLYRDKATLVSIMSQISKFFSTHQSPSCNGWFNSSHFLNFLNASTK